MPFFSVSIDVGSEEAPRALPSFPNAENFGNCGCPDRRRRAWGPEMLLHYAGDRAAPSNLSMLVSAEPETLLSRSDPTSTQVIERMGLLVPLGGR